MDDDLIEQATRALHFDEIPICLNWLKEHYHDKVFNQQGEVRFNELEEWFKSKMNNIHGKESTKFIFLFYFKESDDAIHFKLRWG